MDQVFASIKVGLTSNDRLRQSPVMLLVLQYAAARKDISSIASAACDKIIVSPPSAVCKKLAFDLIRCMRLTGEQWEVVCRGIRNDFDFSDSDVTAAAVSFLSAIPSWRLGKFITDCSKEVLNCIVHENPNLRYAIVETLGCLLTHECCIVGQSGDVVAVERRVYAASFGSCFENRFREYRTFVFEV